MSLLTTPNAGRYGVIYSDPPWKFLTRSPKGVGRKSPDHHYPTETIEDLCAMPVGQVAARDAFLFMWVTWPHLPHAFTLAEAYGFTYSTGGPWAKQSSTGRTWQFGTGYIFRSASEPLLVFRRGNPRWLLKNERNLWVAPVREHSRKPDLVRDMIARGVAPDVPKLEMFTRQTFPGWDAWGNDVDKFPAARPRRTVRAGS